MCCLARSTCLYACLSIYLSRSTCFMLYALFHAFLCFDLFFSCVVWLDPHVSLLFTCLSVFPTCFMLYAVFSYVLFLFLLYVDFRVTCSHAWYLVYGYALLRSTSLYACLMLLCLCLCLHMIVSLLIWSICFMPSSMCLCTPCHVCVLRPRPCLSCHVLL